MTAIGNRQLISDKWLIKHFVDQLSLVSVDSETWTKTYIDPTTNQKWISHYVDATSHGGGQNLLGRLPLPSTDKLIDIAIHSEHEDEVFAACRTLTNNEELHKQDFRAALLDKLEGLIDKGRQKMVIELTGLSSPLNRQDTLGKSTGQIDADADYFARIADRANKLKGQ